MHVPDAILICSSSRHSGNGVLAVLVFDRLDASLFPLNIHRPNANLSFTESISDIPVSRDKINGQCI